jgi:hypothetical protein
VDTFSFDIFGAIVVWMGFNGRIEDSKWKKTILKRP